jgi:LacI family transcriptional regulator
VSGEVRDRLLAAASRLGYVPDASARTLKQHTSRVIGVVVSDLSNQFYANVATGTEQTLRAAGYQMVIVADDNKSDEEMAAAHTFLALRAPGVVMTPLGSSAQDFLVSHGVAVVEVDRQLCPSRCDSVVLDNVRGAREATSHLIGLGHRRIAVLVVDTQWTSDVGRLKGYRAALRSGGIAIDAALIVKVPPGGDARGHILRLLDTQRPTAIFAANNLLAVETWQILRERRIRVPAEISLVGFDDVAWMDMVKPSITVVSQPVLEMGNSAARLLLRRLADQAAPLEHELLLPSLVLRKSTAPPPTA